MAVHFVHESPLAEGSYSALVRAYGIEFAVHYIKGEIRVYGTQMGAAKGWKGKSSAKAAKAAVAAKIAALGPEFAAAHVALYGEE